MGRKRLKKVDTITLIETFPDGKELHTSTDRDTGEVVSQVWKTFRQSLGGKKPQEEPETERSYKKRVPFARVWLPNLLKIVQQKALTNAQAGILFKLLVFLDWQGTMLVHPETGRAVNTSDIARYLKMDVEYLSDQLDVLMQKGLLGKFIAGAGKPYRYHFNCNLAFFGSRMNDMRDWERFNRDCSFEPAVQIQYKEETDEKRRLRRDM